MGVSRRSLQFQKRLKGKLHAEEETRAPRCSHHDNAMFEDSPEVVPFKIICRIDYLC